MKKDIINLINSAEGTYRLNNISYLRRWTDWYGNPVDILAIEFDIINGVCFSIADNRIISREYDGIIAECQAKTEEFLNAINERLCKDLKAGYRNSRKEI